MKLYLGCAEPPFHKQHYELFPDLDSWVWVDKYVEHPRIFKWDATDLMQINTESVQHIYASHLLEHIEHTKVPDVLSLWYSKLENGGKLTINVPDLEWTAKQIIKLANNGLLDGYYNQFGGEHGLQEIIYGSEDHAGEYHKSGYIQPYLYDLLVKAGFKTITMMRFEDAHDMGVILAEGTK